MMKVWIIVLLFVHMLTICLGCHLESGTFVENSAIGLHIKSNGFPSSQYAPNTDECWVIWNSANHTLRIWFHDFDTELLYDKVVVYDDSYSNDQRLMADLTGSQTTVSPQVYYTNGSYMFIAFTSDGSVERQGWQACVCGENISCNCSWDTPIASNTTSDIGTDIANIIYVAYIWAILQYVGYVLVVLVPICIGIGIVYSMNKRRNRNRGVVINHTGMTRAPPGTYPVQAPAYPNQEQQGPVYPNQEKQGPVYPNQEQQGPVYPNQENQGPVYPNQEQQGSVYPNQEQQGLVYPKQGQQVVPPSAYQPQYGPGSYPMQQFAPPPGNYPVQQGFVYHNQAAVYPNQEQQGITPTDHQPQYGPENK